MCVFEPRFLGFQRQRSDASSDVDVEAMEIESSEVEVEDLDVWSRRTCM